jgi:lipid A 4'-phosphatase
MRFPLQKTFIASTIVAALVFTIFPGIDLVVSGLFYRDGAFYLRDNVVVKFLYRYGERPVEITAAAALILYLLSRVMRRQAMFGRPRRVWLYLFFVAAIGPGLIVNSALKDHFGRARPVQVGAFGGDRAFTPVLMPAQECKRNCSFPCGHCAAGFYFLSMGFVLSGRWRTVGFGGGLVFGALLSLVRLVQGGHFLSDVVFSLIIVYAVSALLHYAMFRESYRPAATGA